MQKKQLYQKAGMAIIIDLNYRNYFVRANILRSDKDKELFTVTYELSSDSINHWYRIEQAPFMLHSAGNINIEVVRFTFDKFAEGYFKPFINECEAEMLALDIGIQSLEQHQPGI